MSTLKPVGVDYDTRQGRHRRSGRLVRRRRRQIGRRRFRNDDCWRCLMGPRRVDTTKCTKLVKIRQDTTENEKYLVGVAEMLLN